MEKKWLRYSRLSALYIFLALPWGVSQSQDVTNASPVEIQVEVPIKENNLMDARANAQRLAFELAVEKSLGAQADSKVVLERRARAGQFIRAFTLKTELVENGILKMTYDIEVNFENRSESSQASTSGEDIVLDIYWKDKPVSYQEIQSLIETQYHVRPQSYRLGYRLLQLRFLPGTSVEPIRKTIAETFGVRVEPLSTLEPSPEVSPSAPPKALPDVGSEN